VPRCDRVVGEALPMCSRPLRSTGRRLEAAGRWPRPRSRRELPARDVPRRRSVLCGAPVSRFRGSRLRRGPPRATHGASKDADADPRASTPITIIEIASFTVGGDRRADRPQSRRLPSSYQVTLGGLGAAAATQRWQVSSRADMRESGQPPPPESASLSGRHHRARMTLSSGIPLGEVSG